MNKTTMPDHVHRKKQLIAQGALHRAEILAAREAVRAGLRPDLIARNLLQQVALMALTAFRNKGVIAGINLPAALPLVMNGVSTLSRKISRKLLLRGLFVTATVAVVTGIVVARRKKAAHAVEPVR